jgi:serine-type D-Ala-D-Ala carboxypeptidase (penicillin-binding protein 5/6)
MLLHSHKVIASANSRTVTEIASLTKIMTCIMTLEVSRRFHVDISHEDITIGAFEQNIGGTSANIRKGEIYTVEQLLFGLMLPSGNDASLALAAWAGKKLL